VIKLAEGERLKTIEGKAIRGREEKDVATDRWTFGGVGIEKNGDWE